MSTLKELTVGRGDLLQVDPRKLGVIPDFNVRNFNPKSDSDDAELLESVKANGVLEPLLIMQKDGQWVVSSGHRRLAATMAAIEQGAEIKSIPCRTAPRGYNDQQATFDLIARNSGKPLTMLQQSIVIGRLSAYGFSDQEIAQKIGRTQAHVSNCKTILSTPKAIQNRIAENKVAATLVLDLARKHNGSETKLVEKIEEAIKVAERNGKKKATKKAVKQVEAKEDKANKPENTVEEPEVVSGEQEPEAPKKRINYEKLLITLQGKATKAQESLSGEKPNINDALSYLDDIQAALGKALSQ